MLYMLLLIVIMLTFISYHLRKDFLSASFVTNVIFLMGIVFTIIGNKKWGIPINSKIVIIIFFSLLLILVGESVFTSNKKSTNIDVNITISRKILSLFIILFFVTFIVYIYSIFPIMRSMGYGETRYGLFYYMRNATLNDLIPRNYIFSIIFLFTQSMGYVSTFYLVLNNDKRNTIFHLLIIFAMIISFIIGTARINFIILGIYTSALLIYKFREKDILKAFKTIIFIFIIVLILFSVLGRLRGFSTASSFDNIIFYGGSSIGAFSMFIDEYNSVINPHLGYETFTGLRTLLNRFYSDFNPGVRFLEFVVFPNGDRTNIYTGFRSYIADFGLLGNFIIMFMIGIVYSFMRIKSKSKNYLWIIIYSYYLSNLALLLFSAELTSMLFSITQIFQVGFIIVIFKYLYKNKERV